MPDDYEAMLPGFQYAESRGEADPWAAVGDQGASRGAYQIQPIMYQDIQRVYPNDWGQMSYEQMLSKPESQTSAILSGLRMLEEHYGLTGDALLSGWNTGPTKARKGYRNQKYIDTYKEGIRRHQNRRQTPLDLLRGK